MRRCRAVLLLVLAWSVSTAGFAATYTLPGGPLPAGCTLTSPVLVTCTSLSLNNSGDTLIVTAPVTLQVNGNFSYGPNVHINQGSTTSNLTFNVTGSWNGGNGGHFNANLNVASITLNQNSYVGGNLVASGTVSANTNNNQFIGNVTAGGNITLGGNNTVGGGITSTAGNVFVVYGSVAAGVSVPNGSFGSGSNSNGVQISGDLAAKGNIYLDIHSTVTGNATSSNGTLETNNYVHIHGNATAQGKITLGNWTEVDGNVHSVSDGVETKNEVFVGGGIDASGTITLGHQSEITGNVQTDNGGVNVSNGVQIGGSIAATGSVYLGFQSDVEGSVETGGGVSTGQQVTVGGSIVAGGNVNLNWMDNIGGNINTPGSVTGNGSTVGGYVNTGSGSAPGVNAGTVCDTDPAYQDSNYSPCPGYEPEPEVLYYKLSFNGSGLTCEPVEVLVQACADAGCTSLATITGSVDVTVSGPAIVAPSTVGFADSGIGSTSLSLISPGLYTLGLSSISVSADQPWQCDPAGCVVNADGDGVAFTWSTIPTQTAGNNFAVALTAPSCGGAFENQTVSVALSLECNDPVSCYDASLLTAQGVPLAVAPGVVLSLGFDASGTALLSFNYEDAGRITLKAHATLQSGPVDGVSNPFVVKPASIGFGFLNAVNSSNPNGNPGDGVFARAGDDFEVSLEARSATGAITPNFGNENVPALMTLEGSASVVNPNPGVSIGPVFVKENFSKIAPGTFHSNRVRYGEVGEAKFSAFIDGGDYLGAGPLVIENTTVVGFFIPWEFSIQAGMVVPACTVVPPGFSYMGQAFVVSVSAEARVRLDDDSLNAAANYAGSLAQATVQLVGADLGGGTDLSARLNPVSFNLAWAAGIGSISNVPVTLTRVAETGPYLALQLGARVIEPGVSFGDADFNASNANCVNDHDCNATKLGDPAPIVLGRLMLADTFGPETADAPVTLEAQYWNGSSFVRALNAADGVHDSCTLLDYRKLEALTSLGSSTEAGSISATLSNARNLVDSLYWTAPLEPGSFRFRYELDALPWLRDTSAGEPQFDANGDPQATASFGSYRGHDRILNWQILPLP